MDSVDKYQEELTKLMSDFPDENGHDNLKPDTDKDYMMNSPHVVGYSSISEQQFIFQNLLIGFNSKTYSILDIGCGRGDLYGYIKKIHKSVLSYIGLDHNPNMADIAKKKYNIDINTGAFETSTPQKADWVVASGFFTPRRCETEDKDLHKLFEDIDKMYSLANNVVAFNLLSPIGNELTEGFFYVHPGLIMDMLIEKYRYVTVRNNYSNDVYTVTIYKF